MAPSSTARDALLRRLEKLLIIQEKLLARYGDLVGMHAADVAEDRSDRLELHVEVGRQLVRKIVAYGKAIEPLRAEYRSRYGRLPDMEARLQGIDEAVGEIVSASARVRDRIRTEADRVRTEISCLRIPKRSLSPYGRVPLANRVDISG